MHARAVLAVVPVQPSSWPSCRPKPRTRLPNISFVDITLIKSIVPLGIQEESLQRALKHMWIKSSCTIDSQMSGE